MKTLLICVLTLFFNHMMEKNENRNNEHPIKVSIELPDTIYVNQRDIPIILKVENTTSEELSIRNPARWGNAYPIIRKGVKNMVGIKVQARAAFKDIIQIKANETLKIKFSHSLDAILGVDERQDGLGFLPSGEYDIYFVLNPYGKIFVESNVFKFTLSN